MIQAEHSNGIYAGANPWGYQLNVNHPQIKPYYRRFLKWKGIQFGHAPSDELRREFEAYMMNYFKKGERNVRD